MKKKMKNTYLWFWISSFAIITAAAILICYNIQQMSVIITIVLLYACLVVPTVRIIMGKKLSDTARRFTFVAHVVLLAVIFSLVALIWNFIATYRF